MAILKRTTVTEKKKKPSAPVNSRTGKPLADFASKRKAAAAKLSESRSRRGAPAPTKAAPKSTSTPLADLMAHDVRRRNRVTRK